MQLAINYAAFSKTMILAKILIENNADINNLCDSSWSSLHLAIKRSLIDVVCLLLENGAKIDKTALTVAVQFGKPEVCKLILSKDNLTNFKPNPKSPSLLHLAVEKQCLKTIQILIDLGAEVNCKDDKGVTPLYKAIVNYNREIVSLLIENGADINATTISGISPLHISVGNFDPNLKITRMLLQKGANVMAVDKSGKTPFELAVAINNKPLMNLFLNHGAIDDLKRNIKISLIEAVKGGYEGITKYLINQGANVNAKDDHGYFPLHIAVAYKFKEIAGILIRNGASIDALHDDGRSALHYTVYQKDANMTEFLIMNGANVNVRHLHNFATPLHYAVFFNGDIEISKLLIQNGAEIDAKTPHVGVTPLMMAMIKGLDNMAKILIQNGASTNIKTFEIALEVKIKRFLKLLMYTKFQ